MGTGIGGFVVTCMWLLAFNLYMRPKCYLSTVISDEACHYKLVNTKITRIRESNVKIKIKYF